MTMRDDELNTFVDQMAAKWGVGGMDAGTIYGQFAVEVARAYALQVAEEAALIADAAAGSIAQNIDEMYVALNIGAAIRARFTSPASHPSAES